MRRVRRPELTLASLFLLVALARTLGAEVLVVDSTADVADLDPGDGSCSALVTLPGPTFELRCTLRAAVQEANALGGKDVIQVPAGIYSLAITGAELGDELVPAVEDLDLLEQVEIIGSEGTILDGTDRFRIFHIEAADEVRLSNLVLRNGRTGTSGGCVRSLTSSLVLENVTIRGCDAPSGVGGGLFAVSFPSFTSDLGIRDSWITNNSAIHSGGMSISGNVSSGMRVTITGTTLSGNEAAGFGGGGRIDFTAESLTMVNSTVTGNVASGEGGGLFIQIPAELYQVTVTDNVGGRGGGLYTDVDPVDGVVFLQGTVLSGNRLYALSALPEPDCGGEHRASFHSGGYNLVGTLCPAYSGHPFDVLGLAPRLLSLGDHGGPTPTRLPRRDSPVVDRGASSTSDCRGGPFDADQRNLPRLVDGDADGTIRCDIGAVELQAVEVHVIFYADFEEGDLSAWSSSVTG